MFRHIILAVSLLSCNKTIHKAPEVLPLDKTKKESLDEKYQLYLKLQPQGLDSDGWPTLHSKCDALGFLSLCKTAGGCVKADYFAAEESPGKWHRNQHKNCVETGGSKTSISKDMLMMGFVYGLYGMDKPTAIGYFARLEEYGKANDWIMGYPAETIEDLGRVYMTPTMTLTLYNILQFLGRPVEDDDSVARVPGGYQAHLRVLDMMVQAKIKGGLDAVQMRDIKELHSRDPRNALYQAVFHRWWDGQMDEVADILLDEKLFPSDRLPNSSDRCEAYLWQRDQGRDWEPCDEQLTHDGIDFMFAYWVAGFGK